MTVRWSVTFKLSVAASALALGVIGVLAETLLQAEQNRVLGQIALRAQAYAQACREALLPREDVFALHFATEEALKEPGVAEAGVVDLKGRVLSDSEPSLIGERVASAYRWLAADHPETRPDGRGGYEALAAIPGLAAVRLRVSQASLRLALAAIRRRVCVLAGLAGLLNIAGVVLLIARERQRLRSQVGRLVRKEVAREVVDGEIRLEGRRCEVSVLFTDLRGFTTLSEQMSPEEVVGMLNAYFAQMVRIVDAHGGWVDKFIGDGLMAVFGEVRGQPDHAERAAACALELRECIARLNVERIQRGLAALKLGIAINTGAVVAGTVGADRRLEYTVIGDTVNVASRLEHMNAVLGTDLLVSESTRQRAFRSFKFECVGPLNVKGHEAAVLAYRLLRREGAKPVPA